MAIAHVFQHNYTGIQIFVYHVEDRFNLCVRHRRIGAHVPRNQNGHMTTEREPFDFGAQSKRTYAGTTTELFKTPCENEKDFYKKKAEVALFVHWLRGKDLKTIVPEDQREHITSLTYFGEKTRSWDISGVTQVLMMTSFRMQYTFSIWPITMDIYDLWLYCADFEGTPDQYEEHIRNLPPAEERDRHNRRGFLVSRNFGF